MTGISTLTLGVRGSNGVLWESVENSVGILRGNEGSWGIMLGGDRVMKRFKGEMSEGGVGVRSEVTMGNNCQWVNIADQRE